MTEWPGAPLRPPPCRVTAPCLGPRHRRARCLCTSVPGGCFLAGELRGTSAVSLRWAPGCSGEGPRGGPGEARRRADVISSSSLEREGDGEVSGDVLNACCLPSI